MNRCALLLVAATLLAGCSGSRPFGVSTTADGAVEVLSACTDTGISDVRVIDDETLDVLVHLRPLGPRDELPARVEVSEASTTHEIVAAADSPLPDVVRVAADYPLASTFTESVVVDLRELRPDDVATTAVRDDGTLETRIQTRDDFSSARRSCRGWNIPPAVSIILLATFAAGGLIAAVAIWRFVRKPTGPTTTTSRLPHPPSPPTR